MQVKLCWRWKAAYGNVHCLHLLNLLNQTLCNTWLLIKSLRRVRIYDPHVKHILTASLCCFTGFWPERLPTWSLNGSDCEFDRSLTMGLQNIRWKGLQEGHNCIEGISQQTHWAQTHHIKPYPLFFFVKTTSNGMSCKVNFPLSVSLFLFLFVSTGCFIPVSLTTEPFRIE